MITDFTPVTRLTCGIESGILAVGIGVAARIDVVKQCHHVRAVVQILFAVVNDLEMLCKTEQKRTLGVVPTDIAIVELAALLAFHGHPGAVGVVDIAVLGQTDERKTLEDMDSFPDPEIASDVTLTDNQTFHAVILCDHLHTLRDVL